MLLWKRRYEISQSFIDKVQSYLKLNFPIDYLEIVKSYDSFGLEVFHKGEYYEPMVQVYDERYEGINFYQYREYAVEGDILKTPIFDVRKNHFSALPVPEKLFIFAGTSGKHHFLFDYRENEKEPSILFWDTDESIEDAFTLTKEEFEKSYNIKIEEARSRGFYKVADSFKEFMEMIVPDEE